jgi:hypothetical protein
MSFRVHGIPGWIASLPGLRANPANRTIDSKPLIVSRCAKPSVAITDPYSHRCFQ